MLIWRKIKTPYLKYSFLFLSTYLFCECVYVHMCVITGQLVEVPSIYHEGYGVELRLSDWAASAFTCHAILLALKYSFCCMYCLVCQLLLLRPLSVGGLERFPFAFGRKGFEESVIVVWYLTNWSRLLHQMVHGMQQREYVCWALSWCWHLMPRF